MKAFRPTRLLLLGLLVATAACSGKSSPTEVDNVTAASSASPSVATRAGNLTVVDHNCGSSLDVLHMAGEVDTTMRIAVRQNPDVFANGLPLDGYELHARTPGASADRCHGAPACFERAGSGGRLHVQCDGAGVEHETAHALAWAAGLPCWETVYHTTNFRCEQTSDMYGD